MTAAIGFHVTSHRSPTRKLSLYAPKSKVGSGVEQKRPAPLLTCPLAECSLKSGILSARGDSGALAVFSSFFAGREEKFFLLHTYPIYDSCSPRFEKACPQQFRSRELFSPLTV